MKLRPAKLPAKLPQFGGYLDTRLIHDDQHVLLARFRFFSVILGGWILVPKGFITDFASVPRIVGAYLLFGGRGKRASVIHDWLYALGLLDPVKWPRELCDRIFKEALEASTHLKDGVEVKSYSAFTIQAMYLGVRIGGGSGYKGPNLPQEPAVDAVIDAGGMVAA